MKLLIDMNLALRWVRVLAGAGPRVVQIRADDVRVETIASQIVRALETCADALADGALPSVDVDRARLRLLPLRKAT